MRRNLVAACFLALVAETCCLSADLTSAFTKGDVIALEQRLVQRIASARPEDAFFLASALEMVNTAALKANHDNLCALAQRGCESENLETLSFAWQAAGLLQCTLTSRPESHVEAFVSVLKQNDFGKMYIAAEGLRSLVVDFKVPLPGDVDLGGIAVRLLEMQKYDGTFGTDEEDDGSCLNAGYALHTLSALASMQPASVDVEALGIVGEKVEDLTERLVEGLSDAPSLRTMALTLRGLSRTAQLTKEKLEIGAETLLQLATFTTASKHLSSAQDSHFLLESLRVLASSATAQPLVVQAESRHCESSDEPCSVQFRLTDLYDAPVPGAQLTVTSVMKTGSNKAVKGGGGVQTSVGKDGLASVTLPKLQAGQYVLNLMATADKPFVEVKSARREVWVRGSVEVEGLRVVLAKHGEAGEEVMQAEHTAQYPNRIQSKLHLADTSLLSLHFALSPFAPQQVFIRFHRPSSFSPVFVAKPSPASTSASGSSARFSAHIDIGDAADEHSSFVSGEYEIQLLLGDALLTAPLLWPIAHASIALPRPSEPPAFDNATQAEHVPAPPAETDALAMGFAGSVVLASIMVGRGVLGVLWRAPPEKKSDVRAIATSRGGTAAALALQAAMVGYYALVVLFWVHLSLSYLLGAVCVAFPAMLGLVWYVSSSTPQPLKQT